MVGGSQLQTEALLTVKEVAEMLRVSAGWVYDHSRGRKRPALKCVSLGGTVLRFKRSDVQEFIESWTQ